jgi:hypothetical protein
MKSYALGAVQGEQPSTPLNAVYASFPVVITCRPPWPHHYCAAQDVGQVQTLMLYRIVWPVPRLTWILQKVIKMLRSKVCRIWCFHGSDYEEWRLLGYKTPVHTSQETHYVSATKPSRLILCKIWGFYCGDYEEWRLLGYKNPVRTSQETHYVSATEPNRLMLCKIWGVHGSDYEETRTTYTEPHPRRHHTSE